MRLTFGIFIIQLLFTGALLFTVDQSEIDSQSMRGRSFIDYFTKFYTPICSMKCSENGKILRKLISLIFLCLEVFICRGTCYKTECNYEHKRLWIVQYTLWHASIWLWVSKWLLQYAWYLLSDLLRFKRLLWWRV